MDNTMLAIRLKQLRSNHNYTQTEFAEKINITQSALSAYEKGDRTPSLEILTAIAREFNISLDWLCGLSDKEASTSIISTYSDIIKALVMIADSTINIEISYDVPIEYRGCCEDAPELGTIHFDDSKITTFLHEWQDMLRLLNNGTIKKSLYDLWLDDQLEKYNEPISLNNQIWGTGSPRNPSSANEGLPFT